MLILDFRWQQNPKRKEPPAETGPSSHLEGTDTHTDTQEAVSVGGANTWLRAAVSASRREQKTFFATTENSLTSCNLQMLFPVCVASSTVTLVANVHLLPLTFLSRLRLRKGKYCKMSFVRKMTQIQKLKY